MSLITTRIAPHYQMLGIHLFYLSFYVLPTKPKGELRSYKLLKRIISCKLVGVFITSYLNMSRDPSTVPLPARYSHHSMPLGNLVTMEILFWQPEGLSEPPDYQRKY